jgi:acyl carrier protein
MSGAHAAPGTEVEPALAEIWEEVLGQGPVGLDDDFFLSGGDSVSAIHVLFRIEERLGAVVDVTQMFDHPTVRALAEVVGREGAAVPPPRIEPRARRS